MSRETLSIKKIFDSAFQHYQNGNLKEAEILFKKVLELIPNHFSSTFLLGTLSAQIKKYQTAKKLLEEAVEINPNNAEVHNNLGNVFYELNKYQEAESSYQKATKINPGYAEAYYNLGNVLHKLGKNQEAESSYQKAIKINPSYVEAHNNLGNVSQELDQHQEAISCYQKVIQINPNDVKAHNNLGKVFQKLNQFKEAIKCFQIAIGIEPNNLTSHWLSMNTFPIIYEKFKEINVYRKRFEASINKINQLLDLNLNYSKKQIIDALESSTNFYLHYQGRDNLKLQKKYAQLVERLTQRVYPQLHKERKKNVLSKYIKIGFVSSYFKKHSVSKTFKNWILKLESNLFKTYIYYAGKKVDQITNKIKEHADNFYSYTDVDQIINQIYKDNLDILIYLEIGMNPKMQILGSLRLVPIQCNTWGHPITSGLKNIDYYFSSQLMEEKYSQKHYTEKLINLPGIGVDYNHPDISTIKKPKILNKSNKIIFLNLQSLFKLLPQDDHIYIDILKKQPKSCFWFMEGEQNSITSIFKKRIFKLFQNHDLLFNEYFIFHPRCRQHIEFLGLIEQSDIILDSFNWSGCNTSFDAISLNKPIVTCPSRFMRGRHTYSFLKKLNIDETIANSKEDYVKIAIKLANDINFRNDISNKIKKNKNKLFNDDKPIRFLENFFKKIKKI